MKMHESGLLSYLDLVVDFHFVVSQIVMNNRVNCDIIEMNVFTNLKKANTGNWC